MEIFKKTFLTVCLFLAGTFFIFPLMSQQRDAQWKRVLEEQEKLANKAITSAYEGISKMTFLADKNIKNPPRGMKLEIEKKSDSVLFRLNGFKYNKDLDNNMVGFVRDSMIIQFKSNKVARLERIVYKKNYNSEESIILRIVDQSPNAKDHNNILVSRTANGVTVIRTKFGDLQNTPGNQDRTLFKSKFAEYVKNLSLLLNRIAFRTRMMEKSIQKTIFTDFQPLFQN